MQMKSLNRKNAQGKLVITPSSALQTKMRRDSRKNKQLKDIGSRLGFP